ncbi:MFS transporter [Ardenticatena maritima]
MHRAQESSMTTHDHTEPIGYLELIRENRNFRALWLGQIVSLLGDWFNLIGSASLVATLTQSGFAVGGLFIVRMLAPFIVSPVAGVVADRYNRKQVLIITDLARAVIVLGFLLVRRPEHVWLLYALTALQLSVSGFFFPTRSAILPDIVPRNGLGAANAISSATWSVMLSLGAALGGLVAGQFGIYTAFVVDALTFLLSAFFIMQVRYTSVPTLDGTMTLATAIRDYIEGLAYLRHHFDILMIALQKTFVALAVSGGFQVVQVVMAEQIYPIGEGGSTSLGLMYAVVGVGTGVGPILARAFTGDREWPLRWAILVSYFLSAVGLLLIAPLGAFWVVLLGMLLRGVGGGIGWVFSTQLLLDLLPDRVRGRVFSTEFAMFTLANAVGAAVVGRALDLSISLSLLMLAMAGLSIVSALVWGAWLLMMRRRA